MDKLLREVDKVLKIIPTIVRIESKKFFEESFRRKGYIDRSMKRWKPNKKGTSVLVKSSALMNSLQVTGGRSFVRIKSNSPYAEVHNSGLTVQRTSKKGLSYSVTYPQRQFMGSSSFLKKRLVKQIELEFKQAFNKI